MLKDREIEAWLNNLFNIDIEVSRLNVYAFTPCLHATRSTCIGYIQIGLYIVVNCIFMHIL